MRVLVLASALLLLLNAEASGGDREKDRVTSLPFAKEEDFKSAQFSGYLSISKQKFIHYMYYESEGDPNKDPLFIWTNGGPGCSGLLGLFTEMGPWRPVRNESSGTVMLTRNPYSWTRRVNMVFIEQPAGVGFSYVTDRSIYFSYNDDVAMRDNLLIIEAFLARFPERLHNELYLSSESYGGHYTPELARYILQSSSKVKSQLRGIMVGNPYVNFASMGVAGAWGMWGTQVVPLSIWDAFVANGCDQFDISINDFIVDCWDIYEDMESQMGDLNPYALMFPVCSQTMLGGNEKKEKSILPQARSRQSTLMKQKLRSFALKRREQLLNDESRQLQQKQKQKGHPPQGQVRQAPVEIDISLQGSTIDVRLKDESSADDGDDKVGGGWVFGESSSSNTAVRYNPCAESFLEEYLNYPHVKSALHVKESITWENCNDVIFNNWPEEDFFYRNTTHIYGQLRALNRLKILIFSGDVDDVCATIGTQAWIYKEGGEVKTVWESWYANGQTAGYLTIFDGSFTFATVHTAGHEVPAYQPIRAYTLLQSFLENDLFYSVPSWEEPSLDEDEEMESMQHVWQVIFMAVAAFVALFLLGSAIVYFAKKHFFGRRGASGRNGSIVIDYGRALSRDNELGLDVSQYQDRKESSSRTKTDNSTISPLAVDPRIVFSSDSEEDVSTRGLDDDGLELPMRVLGGVTSTEDELNPIDVVDITVNDR